jgi:membrane-bound lytic murein transglycosylase B
MTKRVMTLIVIALAIAIAPMASVAAGTADAVESLKAAREKLVALLDTTDKGTQTVLIDQIHKASDTVDKQLDSILADASTSADLKAKVTEAKSVWEEFKKTRETEIIPAVQAGNPQKGKDLAVGVQKDRFKKIMTLLM